MTPERVRITTPFIRLDALLKFSGAAATGGEAKARIQAGHVRVNGEPETRRGRKVIPGDHVELREEDGRVAARILVEGP